jgi:prepilin-type N-terminal cleavage/methylation domain-containing protein
MASRLQEKEFVKMSKAYSKVRAFTLIELLVVISIIAVLISILLPALSAARAEGAKLKGLANMRAVTQTALNYANDDPKGIFGPIHPAALQFRFEGYAEYGGGPGDMNYVGWNDNFDPRTRPFNKLMIGTEIVANTQPGDRGVFQIFQCPGDDFGWQFWPAFGSDRRETERSYYTANGTAFRMNNLTFSDGAILGVYGRPVSRIPDSGSTVGFMEARAYQTLWTNEVWGELGRGGLADLLGELTGWHKSRGKFSLSFADGHGSFSDMGKGTFYEHIDSQEKDVRGTWGRLDCLPDEAGADVAAQN